MTQPLSFDAWVENAGLGLHPRTRGRWRIAACTALALLVSGVAGAKEAGKPSSDRPEASREESRAADGPDILTVDEYAQEIRRDPRGRHGAVALANVLDVTFHRSPLSGAEITRTVAAYRREMDYELFVSGSSSIWGSDTDGLVALARLRAPEHSGWTAGFQIAFEKVSDPPAPAGEEPAVQPVYFNVGPTLGYFYTLHDRVLVQAEIQPNLLQLAGSGARDGVYRGSPMTASIDVSLFFGFYTRAGGGLFVGDGLVPIWAATIGWRRIGEAAAYQDY
jgi:hypothetical protein